MSTCNKMQDFIINPAFYYDLIFSRLCLPNPSFNGLIMICLYSLTDQKYLFLSLAV